jgi:hypothetical protein
LLTASRLKAETCTVSQSPILVSAGKKPKDSYLTSQKSEARVYKNEEAAYGCLFFASNILENKK